jgi:tetratricopeptide (TPR) repeat protein
MKILFKISVCLSFVITTSLFYSCENKKETKNTDSTNQDTTESSTAIAEITSQISGEPGNATLYYKRARMHSRDKNLAAAYDDLNKAMQIDSNNAEYYMLMADVSFQLNKIKNAKYSLERVRQINPENYDAALRLSELYLYVRQNNLSMQYADTVLSKQPDNGKALLLKGFNLKEKGDTTAAIRVLQKAVEYDQQFFEAYMQLGVLMQLKNNPLALEYFNNALRVKPNAEDALYGRGLWYQDHQEINKAIQDYTSILQVNPKNKGAHFNLGYIHQSMLKVYDEAAKHYSSAIEADPSYVEAYYNRGVCYETLGNISVARKDYEKALEIKPDYQAAKNGLSRL